MFATSNLKRKRSIEFQVRFWMGNRDDFNAVSGRPRLPGWAVCLRTASAHGRLWPETMCSPMEWSVNSLTPVAACHIQPWAGDPATYYLVNSLEVRISRTSGIFIQFTLPCFVLHRVKGWIVRFTPRTREPNQAGSIFIMRETKVT